MFRLRFLILLPAIVLRGVRAYPVQKIRTIPPLNDILTDSEANASASPFSNIGSFFHKQWAFMTLGIATLCLMIVLIAVS
ncbi:unnamed protein product [Hymenolepis diminuta]|uniref:Uncharacterized protein n=1 Tax=Hymenolepis diminuta TaxID=6216 RepID=A0A0R3SEU6_HYMDI|nr:unnamed protein product [Hymenolepis diminuta]